MMSREDYPRAQQAYQMVLAQWPDSLDALYGLGLALLFGQRSAAAIPLLRKVLDVIGAQGQPAARAECLTALGKAWWMQHNKAEALRCFNDSQALQATQEQAGWIQTLRDEGVQAAD